MLKEYMPFLLALIAAVAYSLMQISFKHAETPGKSTSPLLLTAWFGILAPFWLGLLAVGEKNSLLTLQFSWEWATWTVIWAACTFAIFPLMILLLQRLTLTQLTAARKAFIVLLTLLADTLLMNHPPHMVTLTACTLILASSIGLGHLKDKREEKKSPTHFTWATAGLTFVLAATMTLQLLAYKKGLALQPDTLSHVAAAKGLAAMFSLALFALPSVRNTKHHIPWGIISIVIACFFVGSLTEAFALTQLSLTQMVAVSLTAPALFSLHDLWRNDLPRTPQTFVYLACIFFGFGALFWG